MLLSTSGKRQKGTIIARYKATNGAATKQHKIKPVQAIKLIKSFTKYISIPFSFTNLNYKI